MKGPPRLSSAALFLCACFCSCCCSRRSGPGARHGCAQKLAAGDNDEQIAARSRALVAEARSAQALPTTRSLATGVRREGEASMRRAAKAADAEDVVTTTACAASSTARSRRCKLLSPDRGERAGGGQGARRRRRRGDAAAGRRRRWRRRPTPTSRRCSSCTAASMELNSGDKAKRASPRSSVLGESSSPNSQDAAARRGRAAEADEDIRVAAQKSLRDGARRALAWGERARRCSSPASPSARSCCWPRSAWPSPTA